MRLRAGVLSVLIFAWFQPSGSIDDAPHYQVLLEARKGHGVVYYLNVKEPLTADRIKALLCDISGQEEHQDLKALTVSLFLNLSEVIFDDGGPGDLDRTYLAVYRWGARTSASKYSLQVYKDPSGKDYAESRNSPFDHRLACPGTPGRQPPSPGTESDVPSLAR